MASSPRYRSRGYLNTQEFTVYINVGELHQIEQWVMEYQNIETGGDLFGLWIDDRTAIVQFVLGPGKQCRRSGVSFFQDIEYLRNAGNYLTQQHGLCNIGQWHSHHRLGLTRPSGGDEHTVWGNMPNLGLDRYIVFIATINESYSYYHERRTQVNINPYLFEMERRHRNGVLDGEIESMEGNSPFRLDRSIQNNIKDGAEKINKVKGDQKLKRQHKTENEPTETASKQPKPEVPDSSTTSGENNEQESSQNKSELAVEDRTEQPNDQGDNSKAQDDSIIQGSNESDDQNSTGEQKQVDNDNGKQVDSEILENDKSKELNNLRDDSKIQVDSITQGSHDDKLNSAGEKIQVENKNGEHVDSEDSENDQSAQPSSQQDGSKEQVDPITKRSHEGEGKNSAGDNDQVENENGKQDDSDVLEEEQSGQPNGQGDDSKEQDGSITQRSNEGDEQNTARENDQVANVDSDQSGGVKEQKKGKNPENIDEQFSIRYTQKGNEQNSSVHKLEEKNVDDHDHDNGDDQNGRANVPEGVAESYMKQDMDESIQYKIPTTQGTEQTEFERSEEKEHENHKDQESVNDEESSPKGTDEKMQTDIDLVNANVNPEKFQVVESGDQNESQIENMEIDNGPAKINEETLEMETESSKEPTSVDEMKDEIPPANIALEDITDTSKKLGTQDPVMSIQDLKTQCDDGSESNNVVNDEETENKQDLNYHNAYMKIKVNSGENNNPAYKPIEDEHPLMLSKQNATKGSSNQSVVTVPISSPISPSKIETNLPTLNINDKHTKMDQELASESKKIENVAVSHSEQLLENPEKCDSTKLGNSDSNENIGSDLISTNPEKKEVTLQQSPSSDTTVLKEDTSNDDTSISTPSPNAIVEDLCGEPMKQTETTFLAKMTDQNEENSHDPSIDSKMNTSDDKDDLENNRSQSMHGELLNKVNNNKRIRSIFDPPESLDDVDTTIPEEDTTPTSIDEEAKHESKNSQGDKEFLIELESEQSVGNECETELQSFEGTDLEICKSAKNENQNKDSPSASENIEAKNEIVDDLITQEQRQDIEQIESIPDSESKICRKKKIKIPKKEKKIFGIKKVEKNDKKSASTTSPSRDDDSDKNTVTNKTKDEGMDAIKVLKSNEGDTSKNSKKGKKNLKIWEWIRKKKKKYRKDEGMDAIEVLKSNEGDTSENSKKVKKNLKIWDRMRKKKYSKEALELTEGENSDIKKNKKEDSRIETSKKKEEDHKKEGNRKTKDKRRKSKNKMESKDGDTQGNKKEESNIKSKKIIVKEKGTEQGKKEKSKNKKKSKKASGLVKNKDGDTDENIQM